MTGPEIQAAYFTPVHYFFYLFTLFILMTIGYQWTWARKCQRFVKVLVVKPDGDTNTEYAPKSGGFVALKSPNSDTTRLWPINKLCAIEMLYPGDGFIPVFLQKKIKTVVVDEEDWEPLLNRGSYSVMVASPDVVRLLRNLADAHPDVAGEITDLADGLSTAPTRDMVASPAVLGNVMTEKVSEMAVTISKDTLDKLAGVMRKLENLPNALVLYIGLGVIIALLVYTVFKVVPSLQSMDVKAMADSIQQIKQALGVK